MPVSWVEMSKPGRDFCEYRPHAAGWRWRPDGYGPPDPASASKAMCRLWPLRVAEGSATWAGNGSVSHVLAWESGGMNVALARSASMVCWIANGLMYGRADAQPPPRRSSRLVGGSNASSSAGRCNRRHLRAFRHKTGGRATDGDRVITGICPTMRLYRD